MVRGRVRRVGIWSEGLVPLHHTPHIYDYMPPLLLYEPEGIEPSLPVRQKCRRRKWPVRDAPCAAHDVPPDIHAKHKKHSVRRQPDLG